MTPASTHNGKNATLTVGHVVGGSFGVAFIVANSAPMPAVLRGFFIVAAAAVLMASSLHGAVTPVLAARGFRSANALPRA